MFCTDKIRISQLDYTNKSLHPLRNGQSLIYTFENLVHHTISHPFVRDLISFTKPVPYCSFLCYDLADTTALRVTSMYFSSSITQAPHFASMITTYQKSIQYRWILSFILVKSIRSLTTESHYFDAASYASRHCSHLPPSFQILLTTRLAFYLPTMSGRTSYRLISLIEILCSKYIYGFWFILYTP